MAFILSMMETNFSFVYQLKTMFSDLGREGEKSPPISVADLVRLFKF